MNFSRAIVRKPGTSFIDGITTANLGVPDHEKAIQQHVAYVNALMQCGLEVDVLEANEDYPDSVFVEDTALLTPECAIITNPGAPSRKGEVVDIEHAVRKYYTHVERIMPPGTVDAGDILMVGNHFYIGISGRTNEAGAAQVIAILREYGMSGSTIQMTYGLHLKSSLAYLGYNTLVVSGDLMLHHELEKFEVIEVPEEESYAANCVRINDTVLMPTGFAVTKERISSAGYNIIETDVSEFRKLDGGISCLSLRF